MKKAFFTAAATLAALPALADRYGIDEAMSESDGSIGGLILALAVLAYGHFKG